LKDLETKVEDLEKATETTNQENGLLRAQVDRLQVEVKEYRKRLSWISNSGQGANPSLASSAPGCAARKSLKSNHNDFQFEFPRFGDVSTNQASNNSTSSSNPTNQPTRSSTLPSKPSIYGVPGVVGRSSQTSSSPQMPGPSHTSTSNSPINALSASPPVPTIQNLASGGGFDSFSGLFSPSLLEASRKASSDYFPQSSPTYSNQVSQKNSDQITGPGRNVRQFSNSSLTNTHSPASSYESQQNNSSIGTSPESSLSSPTQRLTDCGLNTIREENQMQNQFGGKLPFWKELPMSSGDWEKSGTRIISISDDSLDPPDSNITPGLYPNSFNWFAQQNGGGFDPVLFGDYRESQDAVASQDFGAFFKDAFPLPELGSPEHNFGEATPSTVKPDLMTQVDAVQDGKQESAPCEDASKMVPCNKIWSVNTFSRPGFRADVRYRDRLQSMEKFRNGEIDMDNLCSDLRSKARCTERGGVVHEQDLNEILKSA
jgi:AP-1-like transcription factor